MTLISKIFLWVSVIDGRWWMAKLPPYKHTIATYGTAIVGLPSQIAYGGWQKITMPFNNIVVGLHYSGPSMALE